MKKLASDFKRDYILGAAACLAAGVLFLVFPESSGKLVCYLIAAVLSIVGVLQIITYCTTPIIAVEYRLNLAPGIIALAVGVFLFARPDLLMSVLPFVMGVVIVLDSIVRLQNAFDLLRLHAELWWLVLLLAVLTGILGVLMMTNPFSAAETLLRFVGVGLIINGASDIWSLSCLSSRIRKAKRVIVEEAEALRRNAEAIDTVGTEEPDGGEDPQA